ncbi:MAG: hypothetical protein Q8N80_04110 [Candidatus Omnitrophota bacterium]|nr:hypothetical protein [Candidatus Omnitrophota bacterium]
MKKLNCWEYKKCGRETGGVKVLELGVCPASTEEKANTLNCGKNGVRVCWYIAGTFCRGVIQGTYALKLNNCLECDFYKLVTKEEGEDYASLEDTFSKLDNK